MMMFMQRRRRMLSILLAIFFLGTTLGLEAGAPSSGAKTSTSAKTTAKGSSGSVFSALSPKNLLITTGVAVGTKVATQIIKGQRVNFAEAAKSVATAEFAGSVVGGAVGAAGGSVVATVAKAILPGPVGAIAGALLPVLGGHLGSQLGASAGTSMRGQTQFRLMDTLRKIDYVDLAGQTIGSTIGMMLGAPIPVIGPIIGGIVGGFLGGKVAKWAEKFLRANVNLGRMNPFNRGTNMGSGQTIGGSETIMGNPNGGIQIGGAGTTVEGVGGFGSVYTPGGRPSADMGPVTAADVQAAEKVYYENYMQYNKLLEQGRNDEAQKMYQSLQKSQEDYQTLKKMCVEP